MKTSQWYESFYGDEPDWEGDRETIINHIIYGIRFVKIIHGLDKIDKVLLIGTQDGFPEICLLSDKKIYGLEVEAGLEDADKEMYEEIKEWIFMKEDVYPEVIGSYDWNSDPEAVRSIFKEIAEQVGSALEFI